MNQEHEKNNDLINKVQRCGCLLMFLGELIAQSLPASQHGYTLSGEALDGFSILCVDLAHDLLDSLK